MIRNLRLEILNHKGRKVLRKGHKAGRGFLNALRVYFVLFVVKKVFSTEF